MGIIRDDLGLFASAERLLTNHEREVTQLIANAGPGDVPKLVTMATQVYPSRQELVDQLIAKACELATTAHIELLENALVQTPEYFRGSERSIGNEPTRELLQRTIARLEQRRKESGEVPKSPTGNALADLRNANGSQPQQTSLQPIHSRAPQGVGGNPQRRRPVALNMP